MHVILVQCTSYTYWRKSHPAGPSSASETYVHTYVQVVKRKEHRHCGRLHNHNIMLVSTKVILRTCVHVFLQR